MLCLAGKAYARAMRGHVLLQSTLMEILLYCLLPEFSTEGDNESVAFAPETAICALTNEEIDDVQSLYQQVWSQKLLLGSCDVENPELTDKPWQL